MPPLGCPNLDLQREVDQLHLNEQLFKERHVVLLRLALSQLQPERDFEQKLRDFTEAVSDYFQVARAGVWLLDRDRKHLECVDHFIRADRSHQTGAVLATEDYPNYFASLSQQRVIAANNADSDPRTREFSRNYLAMYGITSLLETPIRVRGEVRGVFCCEHVGTPRPWSTEDQQFVAVLADLITMTISAHDVHCAEEQLRKSQQLYRTVVEDQTDLVARYLPDGTRILVNEAYCRYHGRSREELLGGKLWEVLAEDAQQIVRDQLEALTPSEPVGIYEHSFGRPDGSYSIVQWLNRAIFDESGNVREFQAIGRDITEHRKSEERLRVSEQLESTAMLASGIAHDFNNLLTPILVGAEKLRNCQRLDHDCQQSADELVAAAQQAKDLVSQLLALGQNDTEDPPAGLSVEESVRASLRIIANSLPEGVQLRTKIDLAGQTIAADATDVYQILSNLCTNAVQAMDGGEIEVRIDAIGIEAASYLRLEVADTGSGIAPENLENVFTPYFSTKRAGEGTGLGLSIVRSIVSRLGGKITLESEEGAGTKFTVLIPCVPTREFRSFQILSPQQSRIPTSGTKQEVRRETAEAPKLDVEPAVASSAEDEFHQILIVDDEELIRKSMTRLLNVLGYDCLAVSSIEESVHALQQQPFDVVVIDMRLSSGSGLHAAAKLREAAAAAHSGREPRFIAMSGVGNAAQVLADPKSGHYFDAFLSKPFSGKELSAVLSGAAAR